MSDSGDVLSDSGRSINSFSADSSPSSSPSSSSGGLPAPYSYEPSGTESDSFIESEDSSDSDHDRLTHTSCYHNFEPTR